MTYELQHSEIPQPKLLDIDPVSAAPWPLPPVKRWEPVVWNERPDKGCNFSAQALGYVCGRFFARWL